MPVATSRSPFSEAGLPDENGWDRRRRRIALLIEHSAIALFLEQGYHQTTMAEVADAANVSLRTVTRYFPLKEDLLLSVPRRRRQTTMEGLASVAGSSDPVADTIAMFQAMAVALQDDLAEFEHWTRVVDQTPDMRDLAAGAHFLETVDRLAEIIGAARGTDPDADPAPHIIATALMASLDATIRWWHARGAVEDWPPLLSRMLDTLRDGFKSQP